MSTATVDVADAARPQPEMVMALLTADPASGMATSVAFVPLHPAGAWPPPLLTTCSSRFGEFVPECRRWRDSDRVEQAKDHG